MFFALLFATITLKAPTLEMWRMTISYGVLLGLVLAIDGWYSSFKQKKSRLDASGFYLGDLPKQLLAGTLLTLLVLIAVLGVSGQLSKFNWEGTPEQIWEIIFQVGVVAFVESVVFQFVLPSWTYGAIWSQVVFGFMHWEMAFTLDSLLFPMFAMSMGLLWLGCVALRNRGKGTWWSDYFGLGFVIGSHATFNVMVTLYRVEIFNVVIEWLNAIWVW